MKQHWTDRGENLMVLGVVVGLVANSSSCRAVRSCRAVLYECVRSAVKFQQQQNTAVIGQTIEKFGALNVNVERNRHRIVRSYK